jgi:hypothetical protein
MIKLQDVLERTTRLLSFDMTRTAWKTTPQTLLRCRGNVFTLLLPNNDRGRHRQTHRHMRLTVLLLLSMYSLPRARVYRAVA